MIFDGRALAEKIKQELLSSGKLDGKTLLIIQADGGNTESTYVRLKREMAESLGVRIRVEVLRNKDEVRKRLEGEIEEEGVLVQLPIAGAGRGETQKILNLIPPEKDIDGLTTFSKFQPAVVRAVDKVLAYSFRVAGLRFSTVGVVGAAGMMGKRLASWLTSRALAVDRYDIGSDLSGLAANDIVIGATGSAGLIKPEMVKRGVIAIDLGYPRGDFDPEVRQKAALFTPVPGGVGPLTVVCLFENLASV